MTRGEGRLDVLLSSLAPLLGDDEYVFVSIPGARYGEHASLSPVACVAEEEGLSLIIPQSNADRAGLSYESRFRRISLTVHSSLTACGLSAALSAALAERGISANFVAGTFHDHLFVPSERADEALSLLRALGARHFEGNK